MKKFFAKEFLWTLITLVLAIPLSLLFLSSLDIVSEDRKLGEEEQIFVIELFLIAFAISFLGIYFIRIVIGAIKILAKKEEEEGEK